MPCVRPSHHVAKEVGARLAVDSLLQRGLSAASRRPGRPRARGRHSRATRRATGSGVDLSVGGRAPGRRIRRLAGPDGARPRRRSAARRARRGGDAPGGGSGRSLDRAGPRSPASRANASRDSLTEAPQREATDERDEEGFVLKRRARSLRSREVCELGREGHDGGDALVRRGDRLRVGGVGLPVRRRARPGFLRHAMPTCCIQPGSAMGLWGGLLALGIPTLSGLHAAKSRGHT